MSSGRASSCASPEPAAATEAMDVRWRQVADVLTRYSTALQPGERVMIAMQEIDSYPLAQALYAACIEAGALPQVQFHADSMKQSLLRQGDARQVGWLPEIEAYGMEWADVYFGLRALASAPALTGIPAEAIARHQAAQGRVSALRWQKTRWCLTRVPSPALARQAGIDLAALREMFFAACLLDYEALSRRWQAQAEKLRGSRTARIVAGEETDLSFSVAGRDWCVFAGKINMPDGEIYTAPVNATVNGRIHFEQPAIFGGVVLPDIRLAWRDGQLIHASATANQDYLRRILATDAGASKLGEFAFGLNPCLDVFCRDILYDEKIGGTVHIALGRAYPECGGTNVSSIHWDLVKDMRAGGTVLVDGRTVLADGALQI
ncbi:MAG: aminopeptidase [Chloroflexi bacterium]|nr:aminopeptidase [Chloroflexota bacterium]MCY3582511.1 aminopeptidase [Chloroflexota bacterium]MCY3717413.1 aminopeptidase [Chloroflexota bacterium]MDE2650362.1 aminopeptidase [Chloroflexota bacterium]